ncbi:MAG: diaminopimelate epimerase [Gemmatimonadota bacterium]|jgi:diaminopimelate epimerase
MSRWPAPPRLSASFYKAHGLGNDYLVFEEGDAWTAAPGAVQRVCNRYRGVGSDGIVVLGPARTDGVFPLRMFNPDGSEFERSGNGLRVLASHLARTAKGSSPYRVAVAGELVTLEVRDGGMGAYDVSCEMGRARRGPEAVELDPSALDSDGRLHGPDGERLHVVPVSVGNPHMVVLTDAVTEERLATIGPFLVGHPALAHGANVQLARPSGTADCDALIWERGVGRTSASGTSSCAVAVALVQEGRLAPGEITVHMPGGDLRVTVTEGYDVVLRGPVEEVCTGAVAPRLLAELKG